MSFEDTGWTPVVAFSELAEGTAVRVDLEGTGVLVARGENGSAFAVADRCTHQGAALHRGVAKLRGVDPTITCPAHGSVFSLTDGRVRRGPATRAVDAFETRLTDGTLELRPTR